MQDPKAIRRAVRAGLRPATLAGTREMTADDPAPARLLQAHGLLRTFSYTQPVRRYIAGLFRPTRSGGVRWNSSAPWAALDEGGAGAAATV